MIASALLVRASRSGCCLLAVAVAIGGSPVRGAVIDLRTPEARRALEDLVDVESSPFFVTNRPARFGALGLDAVEGPVSEAEAAPDSEAGDEEGPSAESGAAEGGVLPAGPAVPGATGRRGLVDPEDDTRTRFVKVKLQRAKLQLSMNDLEGAGLICNEILNVDPLNAEAYVVRGAIQAKRDRHTQAIVDFDRAIKADPDLATAHLSRGMSLLRMGRLDRAREDLDQAIRLDPDLSEAYEKRGLVFARQGDFVRAESEFTKAIELDPDSDVAFHNRAVARMRLGREAEARADLETSRRLEEARRRP